MIVSRRKNLMYEILDQMAKNGCDKKTLIEIRENLSDIINSSKDKTPLEMIFPAVDEIINSSAKYLKVENLKGVDIIHGLSSSIYIPGEEDYSIIFYGGKTNELGSMVEPDTPFDVASITKFFTLVLKDKLEDLGIIKKDERLSDLLKDFGDLKDFTLEDLSLLCGELRTEGRIDSASTKEEAEQILKTMYVYSDDRTTNKYTDMGAILTGIAITRRYNEVYGTNYTYDELLNKILFEPLCLENTGFNLKDRIVAGNGNLENLVHDPKTRALGGVTGAAGLFTSSLDQIKFAEAVFKKGIISEENLKKYGTITFPNSVQSNKGHFGLYQKNKEHAKSLCPRDYADGTFTAQGFTGSSMIYDPVNKIHNTIFVSAIKSKTNLIYKDRDNYKDYITNEKANGFIEAGHTYQDSLTKNSLIIKVIKEILDSEEKEKVDMKIRLM